MMPKAQGAVQGRAKADAGRCDGLRSEVLRAVQEQPPGAPSTLAAGWLPAGLRPTGHKSAPGDWLACSLPRQPLGREPRPGSEVGRLSLTWSLRQPQLRTGPGAQGRAVLPPRMQLISRSCLSDTLNVQTGPGDLIHGDRGM